MTHPPDEELDAWAYSLLSPTDAHALEAHVAQCATCAQRLGATARLSVLLGEAAPAKARVVFTPPRILAAAALAAAVLALAFWPRPPALPPPVEDSGPPRAGELFRSHARELESLGRPIRYEALPDPAWQPDDPS